MANLSVTTTQQTTVVQQTTTQRVTLNPPQRPAVLPDESEAARQLLADTYERTSVPAAPSQPTTPTRTIKMIGGGALIGGTASSLATIGAKAVFTDTYHKPTAAGIGLGVALGTGIALVNLETGDKGINAATKGVGGALMGGSIAGMTTSAASAIFTDRLQPVSGKSVLLGAALGGGIALANMETDNQSLDALRKTASGVMIGGSVTGMMSGAAKSIFTDYLHSASTSSMLYGAALGGGIALANVETHDKTSNMIKNTAAGALIGSGAAGIASAAIKTIGSSRLSGASPVVMGLAATLGAGIGLLASDE